MVVAVYDTRRDIALFGRDLFIMISVRRIVFVHVVFVTSVSQRNLEKVI